MFASTKEKLASGIDDQWQEFFGGTFKPKDSTPEEVERARLAAVESRRKLEEKYFIIKQIEGSDLSCPVERKKRKVSEHT